MLLEGVRFPLGVASAGLAILSFLSPAEAEAYLARDLVEAEWSASHAVPVVRQRTARDAATRRRGQPSLIVEGGWGMEAAMFGEYGRPAWALSPTGIESRFSTSRRPELGRLLLEQAHVITKKLGNRSTVGRR